MHALPDVLVERLRNRQAVLVLGAGCSEMARLPGWNTLGERLLDFIEDEAHRNAVLELLHHGHLTSALACVHEMLDEETVTTVVADACIASPQIPDAFKAVAKAPWRGFIVTTFDALWSTVLADDAEVTGRSALAANASSLEEGRGRFLLQLFGRADVPGSLCLCPAQVPARVGSAAASVVANLYQKWSFVFLGFGADDPDLFMLMHRVLGMAQTQAPHFLLAPHLSSEQERTVRAELGLTPVELDAPWDETMTALADIGAQPGRKPSDEDAEAWLDLYLADPADVEAREGLERSVAHLRVQQEWDRLIGILIGRAEIISDPAAQATALHEVALLLEKEMAAPDRAYSVAMHALRLQPRDENLLSDAKRMAQKGGQWDEFLKEAAMLETQGTDADDSTQIALGMARVYARDGEQWDEAIASFQKVLTRDPQNPEALAELESLYRKGERWQPLGALYEKILARDPHNNAAFAKLEELLRQTEQWPPLTALLEKELARNPSDPAAFAKLEELYRKTEQHKPLVELLRKAMARNPTDGSLFAKLEQIYRSTEQWKPLVDMFEALTARDPSNQEALAKLEELYRKTEQWTLLCDLLEMRAQRKGDAEYARGLRMERAGLLIDKLKDIDSAMVVAQGFAHEDAPAAEELYLKALNSDPENAVALAALSDLCNRRGEYQRAAKFAQEGAERSKNPLEKGRLLAQAGLVLLDRLDDQSGQDLLDRALSTDPEQVMAAERLADVREARHDWAALEPLLDMLLRRTPAEDKAARARLHERLGRCAKQLGKRDKAMSHLQAASELCTDSLSLVQTLAELNFEREDWAAAAEGYERVGQLGKDKLSPAEQAAICVRLAECAEHRADVEASLRYREEAAALEPHARVHLDALIVLRSSREEWEQVIDLRRKLLSLVSEVEERAQLWDFMGDTYRDKLKDSNEAAACYGKALTVQPERRQTLYKILDHYSANKEWASAVETLEKLVSLETEPPIRARARYTLAAIYRDELQEYAKAVTVFTQVLEDDPMFMKAFDAIERLLTESKNWKELARAYRRQLKRMPAEAPLEIKLRLWDALAVVAIQHLKNRESATLALEVAAKLDHDNFARQEHLAQVYQQTGPSAAGKAIAQHQYLISKKPERVASYQALAPLFFQSGALDHMWCTASALVYLGQADTRLAAFYATHRPSNLPMATGKMTQELWHKVLHPGEDAYVDALLSLLAPALAMASAVPHKAVGLDRSERVDLSSGAWAYAPVLSYVANTIEAPIPDVFFKKDAPGTVSIVNLKDKNTLTPALVVGPGFAQWTQQSEIVFDITKRLALLRPERFARFALGTPAMVEIAVRAGLQLGGSPIGNGVHGEEVDNLAKTLDPLLTPSLRAELKTVAKRFVEAHGDHLDIPLWIVATDLTAARVALALSGDVCSAARVLASEPSGQSPLPARERIGDLLAFSVSPDHFAVRTALALQVEIPLPPAPAPSPVRRTSHAPMKAQP